MHGSVRICTLVGQCVHIHARCHICARTHVQHVTYTYFNTSATNIHKGLQATHMYSQMHTGTKHLNMYKTHAIYPHAHHAHVIATTYLHVCTYANTCVTSTHMPYLHTVPLAHRPYVHMKCHLHTSLHTCIGVTCTHIFTYTRAHTTCTRAVSQ